MCVSSLFQASTDQNTVWCLHSETGDVLFQIHAHTGPITGVWGGGGGVFVSTCMLLSPVYINTCEYGNFHDCRTVSESPGTWVVGNWQC